MTDDKYKCFISYRNDGANLAAIILAQVIESNFGPDCVFLDKSRLEGGERWGERIETELSHSIVVLALISADWLLARDQYGRRLIDTEEDWVRRELLFGQTKGKKIIPVLIRGCQMPSKEALPKELQFLTEVQFVEFDPTKPRNNSNFLSTLENMGFNRLQRAKISRTPVDPTRYRIASEQQISEFLQDNSKWYKRKIDDRMGIERAYFFETFSDAVRFISAAAWAIAPVRHYPNLEHDYQLVMVWFSTWDLGGKISDYDFQLAKELDRLYKLYSTNLVNKIN